MNLCISQACTMSASFAEDVGACAEANCPALEVWLTKLEKHLESESVAGTQKLLADKNIRLAAASYQGGLLLSQGQERKVHFDHYRRRLELCQGFAIPTIVLVADFRQSPQQIDLQRAVASLAQAAQWAAGFDIDIALEFRAADAFCSTLETAIRLVEECGEANAGVCLDVFHFWIGASKTEDFALLTPANLTHVQICDLAGVPRELARDADRVFPGDGDLPLVEIITRLKDQGYEKFISLELMNPVMWQTQPHQVYELGLAALNRTLGGS